MRVSLFGLFLRCTSLMGPWPKRIQSLLLMISFILDFPVLWILCYTCSYIYFICVLTLLSSVLDTCAHLGSPPGIIPYSPGEFHWLPWILMSRSWSPERVDFTFAAQSSAAVAWISSRPIGATSFQAPVCLSSFHLANSWVPFLFILVRFHVLLYCSFMYIPCTLAFAHVSDMIFM